MNRVEWVTEASSKAVSRRTLVKASAWTVPVVVVAAPAPAYASSALRAGDYVALFDTQGANTIQSNTNGSTWPHGVLSTENRGQHLVRFQLGMQMMIWSDDLYQVSTFDTYKNWVSGLITVQVAFNTQYFALATEISAWVDTADTGSPWRYVSTSTIGDSTTLTFSHDPIAFNGNTLGIPAQTGAFEFSLKVLQPIPVQDAPAPQTAYGRTVTDKMQVTVMSSLGTVYCDYIQEDSDVIGVDPLPAE